MRKIKGFVMRRLGPDSIIVAESADLVDFSKIVSLNSSAAIIWESLPESDFSVTTIADLLTDKYDVGRETALNDAEELVSGWLSAGIIE